ncbi:MAG: PASTA domain-containing protein, partial [Mycobacterium sp.]
NEITIVVGRGPATAAVPDCVGQTVAVCQQILSASGFANTVPVEVDSTAPAGQVMGTDPVAAQTVPQDTVIQIQVSRGNQFVMPDLTGMFWTDAEPRLRALGWTGVLDKGGDVQNSGQRTNAVVTQSPAAGSDVNYGARITLNFAS